MHLVVEGAGRGEVVSEWLLDDHTRVRGEVCLRQSLDHAPEQERRDLQVEHARLRAGDRLGDAVVCRALAEVAGDVREAAGESFEDRFVDGLTRVLDRRPGVLAEVVVGPIVDRDTDDRAAQEATALEPVERVKRHDLRQVAGDPEHHEDVGRAPPARRGGLVGSGLGRARHGGVFALPSHARHAMLLRHPKRRIIPSG